MLLLCERCKYKKYLTSPPKCNWVCTQSSDKRWESIMSYSIMKCAPILQCQEWRILWVKYYQLNHNENIILESNDMVKSPYLFWEYNWKQINCYLSPPTLKLYNYWSDQTIKFETKSSRKNRKQVKFVIIQVNAYYYSSFMCFKVVFAYGIVNFKKYLILKSK